MGTNSTGDKNTAMGYQSFALNTTGANNTAVGYWALVNNTTASNNTAVGTEALRQNTTGNKNVAVGSEALRDNITTSRCTAVGYQALRESESDANTAIGNEAGLVISNGDHNTVVGNEALKSNTSGASNVAVGSLVTVEMDTEPFDQNADFDTSNYTFTAPVTGKYFLHTTVYLQQIPSGASFLSLRITTSNRTYVEIMDPNFSSNLSYHTLPELKTPHHYLSYKQILLLFEPLRQALCTLYQCL